MHWIVRITFLAGKQCPHVLVLQAVDMTHKRFGSFHGEVTIAEVSRW
jgi:hypothetical protein